MIQLRMSAWIPFVDIPEVTARANSARRLFHMSTEAPANALDKFRSARLSVTNITERGLETRICRILTGGDCQPGAAESGIGERPAECAAGWLCGDAADYDAEHCVDIAQLVAFLADTQPETAVDLSLDSDTSARRQFLARLKRAVDARDAPKLDAQFNRLFGARLANPAGAGRMLENTTCRSQDG